ncbi:SDR family NAD(P)-dependent oxidoreductase [Scytonema sp. PRP1]|uniref:SDR family NAD(P)-dependent oxidoreductase n=1 Tax=Scytonema sp. PRP1 TaxID=3120513 RepID=UPI00300D36E9
MTNFSESTHQISSKRLVVALDKAVAQLEAVERSKREPIAIIGMNCRFPGGANDLESFWQLLKDGVDAITEIPSQRWDIDSYYDPDPGTLGKMYIRHAGLLQQVDEFDPLFFGISPREAVSMDPQQRLLLEVSWEALENAGVAPNQLTDSQTGVFLGIGQNDYARLQLNSGDHARINAYDGTGNGFCFASGRLSHILGLRGSNIAVDTACSSSLVAVHLACQSLRAGESNLALAAGVQLILSPEVTIFLSRAQALSPDGRCKTFDAAADGYGRGEGCGVIVLKRLSDAIADGDNILALIRGSAVNHDGQSSGLTVPNKEAQQALISQALANAKVEPSQVSYVEAHGTGTSLGDPIELRALAAALGEGRSKDQPLIVGSVKTNIGHLEAAAGIAGLIKVVLSLQNKEIPPHLHFQTPSPHINWNKLSLRVPESRMPLQGKPRIAGVSSFGMSGTNAHVVLEEAPHLEPVTQAVDRPLHLLSLSAKTEEALKQLALRYEQYIAANPALAIQDICFSAATGRSHFSHRLSVVAESTNQLREKLAAWKAGQDVTGITQAIVPNTRQPKIAFLFTGQGSQYVGMGRQLYETQPTFRQTLDYCDRILRSYLEKPLLAVLYPEPGMSSLLDETAYTQPALFAIEYALAQLWKSWGIEPSSVMGHSVGEYVAATIAGVFSLEDGLKLIAERARLMQALPEEGAMVAVFAPVTQVEAAIEIYCQDVSIASINGPENIVISGKRQAVELVVTNLKANGVETRQLRVSHAFHSPMMEPMLAAFEQIAAQVTFSSPKIDFISNVTGGLSTTEIITPEYWCHHVRQPVRFASGMEKLAELGYQVFVEIGPKPTLLGMGRNCIANSQNQVEHLWLPSLHPGQDNWQQLLQSLGELYVRGLPVDWSSFERDYHRRRLPLPTYPWQQQRYWVDTADLVNRKTRLLSTTNNGASSLHPLLGRPLELAGNSQQIYFESQISQEVPAFLADYLIYHKAILPAAAYLEMAYSAGVSVFKTNNLVVEEVLIQQPLILPKDYLKTIQVILAQEGTLKYSFQIFSLNQLDEDNTKSSWTLHATGKVLVAEKDQQIPQTNLVTWQTRCSEEILVPQYYQQWRDYSIDYGSSFQALKQIWRSPQGSQKDQSTGEALGEVRLPEALFLEAGDYQLHPVLLDACFQVVGATFSDLGKENIYLPVSVKRLQVYSRPHLCLWSYAQVHPVNSSNQQTLSADVRLFAQDGQVIAVVEGLQFKRANREVLLGSTQQSLSDWLYKVEWRPQVLWGRQLPSNYLPTPKQISDPLEPYFTELMTQPDLEIFYGEVLSQLEDLSLAYVVSAFQQMGWEFHLEQRFSTAAFAAQLGVVSQYQRLLSRLLEMLTEAGLLRQSGQEWEVTQVPPLQNPQEQISTLIAKYPVAVAELTMLGRCGLNLPLVLRGECDPLQLLFPEGDLISAAQIYQDSPRAKAINTLAQKAVLSALEKLPKGRGVRVLEIGAGTGGTTSYILPYLNPEQTEYVFTDVGAFFTTQAQKKFQDYPFVRYQILDIEQDPSSQGFENHQYDLIVAANVLHATADLRQTLQHIQQLLAPGGMVLLIEITTRLRWVDLFAGLTEGWWRFADLDLRPKHPLLSVSQWLKLFQEVGFQDAVSVGSELENQGIVSHESVILAQASQFKQEEVNSEPRSWLIFADERGVSQQLVANLQSKGEECTLVFPGKEYEQLSKGEYKIDPMCPADFKRVLKEVLRTNKPHLQGVVHCWSLDAVKAEELTSLDLEAASKQGCGSTLHLIQALAETEFTQPPSVWLVTQGAVPVTISASQSPFTNDYVPGLAQSPLWGMGKVIAKENPKLKCVMVDLDPQATGDRAQALFEEIWSEATEDQIAFRGQSRYVVRLVRNRQTQDTTIQSGKIVGSQHSTATDTNPDLPSIAGDSTYLIIGGLEGLGLLAARWIVEKGARHLVLVEHTEASSVVRSQSREFNLSGAEVIVFQADVSDVEQVAQILATIEESLPPLRGIIHSANVLDDDILPQQNWERFKRVMSPKVQGSWHLHTLTQNLPLDFFVLFSSVASVLSCSGQANYSAANAFLDALAYYRRAQGLAGLSINWGAVAEVGVDANRQAGERMKAQEIPTIAPQQVLEALEQLFSQSSVQVCVTPIDWSQFREKSAATPFLAEFLQVSRQPLEQQFEFLKHLETATAEERRTYLLAYVRSQVAKVLGLNPLQSIDSQQGFFDLGMDSLTSVELKNRLQADLGCSLPSSLAFNYPNVEALVNYLDKEVLDWQSPVINDTNLQKGEDERTAVLEEVEQLSEDEIEALLAQELAGLETLLR